MIKMEMSKNFFSILMGGKYHIQANKNLEYNYSQNPQIPIADELNDLYW